MALYSVASAKGAPGTSTAAVALAAVWSRDVVLADLDPAGGDLALRYRAPNGQPLHPDFGLVSLGAALRRGVADVRVDDHLQRISGGLSVLAGTPSAGQVAGLGPAWTHLAAALAGLPERDVIADLGRYVPGSPVAPVLTASDAVLFVVDPQLEQVAHLRDRLASLSELLHLGSPGGVPVGVAVVTAERDRTSPRDIQRVLDGAGLSVTVLGTIVDDHKSAKALAEGRLAKPDRSLLMRSIRSVALRLDALAAHRLDVLGALTSSGRAPTTGSK